MRSPPCNCPLPASVERQLFSAPSEHVKSHTNTSQQMTLISPLCANVLTYQRQV